MGRSFRAGVALTACFIFSAAAFSQAPQPTRSPDGSSLFKVDPGVEAELKRIMAASDKKEAEEFFKRGQAAWKQFEITETIDNYSKALGLVPAYADALRERGTVFYLIGRHDDAIKDLSAFLKTQPASPDALFYRGMSYSAVAKAYIDAGAHDKESSEAADKGYADFNAAIKQDPSSAAYYNGRGRLCLDFNLYKEAVADFEKAILLESKFAVAYTNLGLAKLLTTGAGLAEMNRAIELNPRYGEAYFNRATYHRIRGEFDEAIPDYTRAIVEHSTNAQYYNGRGMAYLAKGNGALAAQDFSSAIGQKREFAVAYLNRAVTYKRHPATAMEGTSTELGEMIVAQRRKMAADLDAAIKYNPNLADAYLERGLMNWTATGSTMDERTLARINAALADFDKTIKLDSNSARAFGARAAIYKQLGRRDDALADYNKAIALDPKLATAYMGRMGIYCEMGKTELSVADEKKVEELGLAALNICSMRK